MEKIKLYLIYQKYSKYIGAVILLAILFAALALLFQSRLTDIKAENEWTNPNVLKENEIKKLSVLLSSNNKHAYKTLPLPISAEANAAKTKVHQSSNERCHYNGQDYLAGDIIKTAQGWIHCTPTLTFNAENSVPGSPAWTLVQ